MSKYSNCFVSAFFLILSAFTVSTKAQTGAQLIRENRDRAAAEYHYYEYSDTPGTPVPKGYKAFYLSHYSRHGSRYHTGDGYFSASMKYLRAADNAGILSAEGKELMKQIDTLMEEHQGMYGMLTQRGAKEQRGIGLRMYEKYPGIFKGKNGRNEIECVSSYWPRCLVSMANCDLSLQEGCRNMDFTIDTGPKYLDYISMDLDTEEVSERSEDFEDRISKVLPPYGRFFSAMFTDTLKAHKLIPRPVGFMKAVYSSGCISPNTDARPDIFSHFTDDELTREWIVRNDKMYYRYGISKEEGDYVSAIAKPLIMDIVSKADEAVKPGCRVAADLRFGHDVGLLPLIGTIGIKGMDVRYSSDQAHQSWYSFEMIPMAANLQMIFFRNKRNDILVKLLYNEKETTIPAVKPFSGPYYRWQDLREYLVKTADAIPDDNIVKDGDGKERTGVAGM